MAKKHPAEPSTAFWAWSRCIGDLIAFATDPDAETTSSDGWREAVKIDMHDKGDRARDAAPDDANRNQVIRSRKLASQLVRMLNETPELNGVSCRNWSQIDRQVVEQLAELQAVFVKFGDGTVKAVVTSQRHDNPKINKDSLPQNGDVRDLCLHLKAKLSGSASKAACTRDFCETNRIDSTKADSLLRQAERFPHLWRT